MATAINLKDLTEKEQLFTAGHRMCDGCGAPIAARHILLAAEKPVVLVGSTGCLEISTAAMPFTNYKVPWYHSAFENAAAIASGIEAAYRALRRRGRIDKDLGFIVLAGDGGSYDIGLQALSGMLERGHRCLFVCYDNGAYMNTGIQRSGATPYGAWTTTTYSGEAFQGKPQHRKDLTAIAAEHGAYAAQASIHNYRDLFTKVRKALDREGASFLNLFAPCPRGWRYDSSQTVEISRLAVETRFWPLFEVEERGTRWVVNYVPRRPLPVEEFLRKQGRFEHFFQKGNRHLLEEFQREVDRQWDYLLRRAKM